ncbi:MAG: signal peptidase II [Rhodospirillaceae bacterium]
MAISSVPRAGLACAAIGVIADQASKYYMLEHVFRPEGVTETPFASPVVIDILPVFQFHLSWNEGISFSLFNSGTETAVALLLAVTIAITIVMTVWMWRTPRSWLQIGLGLIVGGALGNIIDRASIGAVADFLHVYWQDWHFPTFNIADTCITIGAIIVLLDALFERPHDGKQEPAQSGA